MLFLRYEFVEEICVLLAIAVMGLAGCGNSCYAGFSNNGTGVVISNSGNPGSCSLSNGMGTMSAIMEKTAVCANCAGAARVEHALVTVRGVGVRGGSGEWVELAPGLASAPRQVDVIGDGGPEMLADGVGMEAGSYSEVRVEFAESGASGETNRCGAAAWNCLVFGDGRVEELGLDGVPTEVKMSLENGGALVVPGGRVNVSVKLQTQAVMRMGVMGVDTRNVVMGTAEAVR